MADFERIKVNPAEEDDIVIVAGIAEEPPAQPEASVPGDSAPEPRAAEAAPQPQTAEAADAPASAPGRKKAGYRETTLDDLKGSGMGGMQKVIIALAMVAIAAFVVWYVFLR